VDSTQREGLCAYLPCILPSPASRPAYFFFAQLESVDRPGHYILIASDPNGPVEVEAFQESLVVPGLLEAAMIGLVVMLTGQNPKPGGKAQVTGSS
jgi:hypothetical protein